MSLPPQILRIKRKRTDEPVDSLYLENASSPAKRRVTTSSPEFVFRRLVESAQDVSPNRGVKVPDIIATNPGDEEQASQSLRQRVSTDNNNTTATIRTSISKPSRPPKSILPRKFHLSRAASLRASPHGRILEHSERNRDVAVFIEQAVVDATVSNYDPHPKILQVKEASHLVPNEAALPLRKKPRTPAMTPTTTRPIPELNDNEQSVLYGALQKYAAEEFHLSNSGQIPRNNQEQPSNQAHEQDVVMRDITDSGEIEAGHDDHNESDYVYDTYVRYAKMLEALPGTLNGKDDTDDSFMDAEGKVEDENFGYLVIPETEQTLWETFYASDDGPSSENDWDSEEDDENHENWYGADYPEEEISSGDDRDEDPYRYGYDEWNDSDERNGSDYSDSI